LGYSPYFSTKRNGIGSNLFHFSFSQVTTSDGEVYTADFGLCTFSTGVLGSDMVKFNPPLPDWKQESILKMPMSVYTKIFLKFPHKFWDDKDYILLAGERRGFFPVFRVRSEQIRAHFV
jgi:polyamine oxidase